MNINWKNIYKLYLLRIEYVWVQIGLAMILKLEKIDKYSVSNTGRFNHTKMLIVQSCFLACICPSENNIQALRGEGRVRCELQSGLEGTS